MIEIAEFTEKFRFNREKSLLVGIERECFLTDHKKIVPIAPRVLHNLGGDGTFGYELSSCQLESRVGPCTIRKLKGRLLNLERTLKCAERQLGFRRSHREIAPADMPLDVYPDPTGRYQRITANMPKHILLAACRVIATHVHIGMPDGETAIRVYNEAAKHLPILCHIGDGSKGQRLNVYKVMAVDYIPPHYDDWKHFYKNAVERGFAEDPRKCWHLIRISIHGTVEFRMFGATTDIDKIVGWAKTCRQLCKKAAGR